MKGRLADHSFEQVLRDLLARGGVGVLTLERGPVKKQICIAKGAVRLAASNLRDDRFADFLAARGAATPEMVAEADKEVAAGKKPMDVIAAWGSIDAHALKEYKQAHTIEVLVPCFDWKEGTYRFQEGVPNVVGEILSNVKLTDLKLEHARRTLTPPLIEKVLTDRRRALAPAVPMAEERKRIPFTTAEQFILSKAGNGAPLRAILAHSPENEPELSRAAAALLASGILCFVQAATAASSDQADIYDTLPPGMKSPSDVSSQAEATGSAAAAAEVNYFKQMHSLLIGADHYAILDIDAGASSEDIQRAYYRRAKEIHPDRFLAPPLDVLHRDMEELFAQVLEAYNTLTNPAERKRYDAERLAGAPASKQASADQAAFAKGNFLRGKTLSDEGKYAEALSWLQNAVDADPERPEYLRLLASVQGRNPRLRREAVENYKKAIALDPARPEAYLQLGLLYRRLGDIDPAVEALRECLKWDPSNAEAGTALAEMTRVVGRR